LLALVVVATPPDATLDSGITSSNGAASASLAICPT
jgi:hypothetical protein